MASFLRRFKPGAPMWAQLMLAALLWTCVGGFLLFRGLSAALKLEPAVLLAICISAALVGIGKGLKIMKPTAQKGAKRIYGRGDGTCVMGFISWKTWLFVIGMAVFGALLRRAGLPGWLLGIILCGVGSALLIGSWTYWTALFNQEWRSPPTA